MKLSYYTIDDVRLGHDPVGVNGWRLSQFLRLDDALERYSSMPNTAVKELGMTNGIQVLPLVPYDLAGESVLTANGLTLPFWKDVPEVMETARELVSRLNIRFCLIRDRIVPAPLSETPEDACLADYDAVRGVYVAGMSWLTPAELERRYPFPSRSHHYPLVLKYQVEAVAEDGSTSTLKVTPWEFGRMKRRPKQHI